MRSVAIVLALVALLAGGALYASHHGYRVMPVVRMIHGHR